MRERIIKFLESENLSSARFADDIRVQRSTVSHILSGRNNPSFDFIQKILLKYNHLNAEWLLIGAGSMFKSLKQGNLFENDNKESNISGKTTDNTKKLNPDEIEIKIRDESKIKKEDDSINKKIDEKGDNTLIEKIITIYRDKTFDLYFPAKH